MMVGDDRDTLAFGLEIAQTRSQNFTPEFLRIIALDIFLAAAKEISILEEERDR